MYPLPPRSSPRSAKLRTPPPATMKWSSTRTSTSASASLTRWSTSHLRGSAQPRRLGACERRSQCPRPQTLRRVDWLRIARSHLKNRNKVLYYCNLKGTVSSVHAEVNPCHDVKRSMTSNGRLSRHYLVSRCREQMAAGVHARTIVKFSTGFCGY